MNYLAALLALVITTILTLPILYLTDDRIVTEKEKCFASLRPKRCHVVAYMLRTEPYVEEDRDDEGSLFEKITEGKSKKQDNQEDNGKNWVSVYQYTVGETQYEFRAKRGEFSPNVRLCYEEGHPEAAQEESLETNWQGLFILSTLRFLFPIFVFFIMYFLATLIL